MFVVFKFEYIISVSKLLFYTSLLYLSISATVCRRPREGTNTVPIPAYLANGLPFLHTYTYECKGGFVPSFASPQMTVTCHSDGLLSRGAPWCVGMFMYKYLTFCYLC